MIKDVKDADGMIEKYPCLCPRSKQRSSEYHQRSVRASIDGYWLFL